MFKNTRDGTFGFLTGERKMNIPKGSAVLATPGTLGDLLIDDETVYFYGPNGWTPIGGSGGAIRDIGAAWFFIIAHGTNTGLGDNIGFALVSPATLNYPEGPNIATSSSPYISYASVFYVTSNGPEFPPPSFAVAFDPFNMRIDPYFATTISVPFCTISIISQTNPSFWAKASFGNIGSFNENTPASEALQLTNFVTSGNFILINGDTEIQWTEDAPYPPFQVIIDPMVVWN